MTKSRPERNGFPLPNSSDLFTLSDALTSVLRRLADMA